jgi:hypothetical protein
MHWIAWEELASPKCTGGTGFKDLQVFNLALLGKHGWRLMTHPESLFARVLKSKYFPTTDCMHATVPNRSFATWRAIVAGREALVVGLLKRIGDGDSVSIWTAKWIPGNISMTPSVHTGEEELHCVCDLIDKENRAWKVEIIRKNFIAPEADVILNIPLRRGGGDDFWAWGLERNGIYTIKTAYRSLVTHNESSSLAAVTKSSNYNTQLWSRL